MGLFLLSRGRLPAACDELGLIVPPFQHAIAEVEEVIEHLQRDSEVTRRFAEDTGQAFRTAVAFFRDLFRLVDVRWRPGGGHLMQQASMVGMVILATEFLGGVTGVDSFDMRHSFQV